MSVKFGAAALPEVRLVIPASLAERKLSHTFPVTGTEGELTQASATQAQLSRA